MSIKVYKALRVWSVGIWSQGHRMASTDGYTGLRRTPKVTDLILGPLIVLIVNYSAICIAAIIMSVAAFAVTNSFDVLSQMPSKWWCKILFKTIIKHRSCIFDLTISSMEIVGTSDYLVSCLQRSLWNENQIVNLLYENQFVHVHCLEWKSILQPESSCN